MQSAPEPNTAEARKPASRKPAPWVVAAAVAVPTGLLVLGCLSALPYVDPIRDAYQGWRITHEGHLPLIGPPLAGSVHLGPLWFYLLAIPASFASSMVPFSLFVGVLAATKYFLAYRLGAELCDRRMGVYFAVLLALPTWVAFQLMFLTHVAAVESMILLALLVTIWVSRLPTAARVFVLGLVFGLGLHAHPTFAVAAVPAALLWRRSGAAFAPRFALVATGGFLLPFIPVLWAEWAGTGTTVGGLSAYLAGDLGAIGLWEVPGTLYSLLLNGPRVSFGTVFGALPAAWMEALYVATLIAIVAAGAVGWRHADAAHRSLLGMSVLVLVASVVVIALMRARTPWYMSFALMPALAACLACSLRIGTEHPRLRRLGPVVICAVLLLAASWTWGFTHQVNTRQVLRIPASSLYDINRLALEWERTAPAIGAWRSREFGKFLCSGSRMELLGPVGTAADDRIGLDALLECGRRDQISIGGCSDSTTLSLPAPAWEVLGLSPVQEIAGTGIAAKGQFRCLHGGEALPVANGDVYPFRANLRDGPVLHPEFLKFTLPAAHALVVINQFSFLNWMDRLSVTAAGAPQEATWSDTTTNLYTCPECAGPVEWTVAYRVQRPDQVYVIGLEADLSR